MSFADRLKDKAGPLPVWAWGVIVGLIVIGGMYWYSSRSAAGSASGDGTVAYPDLNGDSAGGGGGTVVSSADGSSGSAPAFSSNLAWETYVLAKLVAEGNSPLTVQVALEKYLKGQTLTAAEQLIVNMAISRFGLPPNGSDTTPQLTTPNITISEIPGVLSTATVSQQSRGVNDTATVNANLAKTYPVNLGNGSYTFAGVTITPPTGGYVTSESDYTVDVRNAAGIIVQKVSPSGVVTNISSNSTPLVSSTSSLPAIDSLVGVGSTTSSSSSSTTASSSGAVTSVQNPVAQYPVINTTPSTTTGSTVNGSNVVTTNYTNGLGIPTTSKQYTVNTSFGPVYVTVTNGVVQGNPYAGLSASQSAELRSKLSALGIG